METDKMDERNKNSKIKIKQKVDKERESDEKRTKI